MKVQFTSDPNKKELDLWNAFSQRHPDGNFFQSPLAYQLFQKTNYYSPFVLFGWEESNLIAVLSGTSISEKGLMALFSQRTIIWGGPIIEQNISENLDILIKHLNKASKNSIYTEFRNLSSMNEFLNTFSKHGFLYKKHLNFIVSISTQVEQQKKISKSKLRQIKSSLKNGAYIEEPNNINEVRQFYKILQELYHKKVNKPLAPFTFFETFFKQRDAGKILLVKHKDTIIGGIVCPIYMNNTIYEWYIAGLDGLYKGIYPSVLATWAPIEYALKNDIKYFDFLGAGSPDTDYGVREFKSKFGGESVEYGRYKRINKPFIYQLGKTGLRLYKLFIG
jgi:lipid II:glycine glycyltransferase (peptidoglycan interpeptide bridge formation enzyme)